MKIKTEYWNVIKQLFYWLLTIDCVFSNVMVVAFKMWCDDINYWLIVIYLEFDDSFKGNCCLIFDWFIFGALVALCKWAGGAFDTVESNNCHCKINNNIFDEHNNFNWKNLTKLKI